MNKDIKCNQQSSNNFLYHVGYLYSFFKDCHVSPEIITKYIAYLHNGRIL